MKCPPLMTLEFPPSLSQSYRCFVLPAGAVAVIANATISFEMGKRDSSKFKKMFRGVIEANRSYLKRSYVV